ncbi:hypothetical protein CIB48_g813 [Xylaria polymorpha]|nr:hypothetical protein CIB48_g813 [Xylaria polymorpha]
MRGRIVVAVPGSKHHAVDDDDDDDDVIKSMPRDFKGGELDGYHRQARRVGELREQEQTRSEVRSDRQRYRHKSANMR